MVHLKAAWFLNPSGCQWKLDVHLLFHTYKKTQLSAAELLGVQLNSLSAPSSPPLMHAVPLSPLIAFTQI